MIRISLGVAIILLLASTAVCKAEDFRKETDQTVGYTQKEVWMAYDGFNKTFLDSNKYIYKTDTPSNRRLTAVMVPQLSGASPFIGKWL